MPVKKIESKPYGSEIEPVTIEHYHTGITEWFNPEPNRYFSVSGTVMHAETNTELSFKKEFAELEDAMKYQTDMSKHFPISDILLKEVVVSELSYYS